MRDAVAMRVVVLAIGVALAGSRGAHATVASATALGRFPVGFERNEGQADPRIAYSLRGTDATAHFASTGVTFALVAQARRWILKLEFVGARPVAPVGDDPAPGVVSYFRGARDRWVTDVAIFHRLVYHDLWPGVDLAFFTKGDQLKYELVVAPGADPARVRLAYHGAEDVSLTADGGIAVRTALATFTDVRPETYQGDGASRRTVKSAFRLERVRDAVFTYGFDVGPYDRTRPLVIDPSLVYAGYIGGGGPLTKSDHGYGIAVDATGAAYVTGQTSTMDGSFPETVGPDLTFNGQDDAFVAKVAPDGTSLVYAGFIGGVNFDAGFGIAVDATGAAYVAGIATSDATTFPVTVGPDLTYGGGGDCFVAKVSPDGTSLVYAGYIGGGSLDRCTGIAVDAAGAAYVTGDAGSSEATFPVSVGPDLTFNGDIFDAFVAKVKPDGTGLEYAGYIGGSGIDEANAIAIDAAGAAYVTGNTDSTEATFPTVAGPDLTQNGLGDVFVAKVAPDGSALVYSGFIGGSINENAFAIAVDGDGAAYVAGRTLSTEDDNFPQLVGPDYTFNGDVDAFVAKVLPSGTGLAYCGYIGGNLYDEAYGIAVDAAGAAYVTGWTSSTQATFWVGGALDSLHNGGQDAFVAKIVPSGAGLSWSGYIGGAGTDAGWAIALGPDDSLYVTGETDSGASTFPETVGPDLSFNGNDSDAFVAKISGLTPPTTTTSSSSTTTTKTTTSTSTTHKSTTSSTVRATTTTSTSAPRPTPTSTTSTTLPVPEQLLCYRTSMSRPITVDLADEFDTGQYSGKAAKLLCTRANAGDVAPADSSDAVGYPIRGHHARRSNVGIVNYLAGFAFRYDTSRTAMLLVPSAQGASALLESPSTTDAYRCVKARLSPRSPAFPRSSGVRLTDRYGTRTMLLKRPTALCVPTAVDGEAIADPATHLVCYKGRTSLKHRAKGVAVEDRFGPASLTLAREIMVCVPSAMESPSP